MSSSNCCFLTCIQISQEADQVVWYSHLFQDKPTKYWKVTGEIGRELRRVRGDMETREMKKIHSHHGGVHNPLNQLDQKENASLCTRRVAAAAASKSLQSCPALCDPIDGSPPGTAVPGILQARTLEWVAISFSNAWKWKVKVKSLSCVWLLVTPWTTAYQAPLYMGFSRQEYWSGLPLPSLTRRVTLGQRAGRSRGFFIVFPLLPNSSPKAWILFL